MRDDPSITGVTGGSRGLAATYDRVRALAATYDAAGNQLRDWAEIGACTMGNGDLLESAILSPLSFAEAERAVLAATTGPDGLLVESVGWETDAILIRVTVSVLAATDELVHASFEVVDHLAGRAIGFGLVAALPGVLLAAAVVGPPAWLVWNHLPPSLQGQLSAGTAGAGAELEDWLMDNPDLVQHAVNGGDGLLDGLWDATTPLTPGGPFGVPSFTPDTESAAGVLAALFGDDGGFNVSLTDLSVPSGDVQPGSLADVMAHLDETNDLTNGTVEIQTITGAGGDVRHIVYLPGTDDMATMPWTQDGDVRDMATNYLLISGQDSAHQQGILQAMQDAGVQPGEPVMLAGHSQGGMVAAAILGEGSDYNVTNVVTAGSPTAQVPGFPPGTHVLSLEHRGDVVPLLDGEDNPDSPQQVTVHFDDDPAGVVGSHDLHHYTNGASAADASDHPSVVQSLQSMYDHGFLASQGQGGATASSQVYEIVRAP